MDRNRCQARVALIVIGAFASFAGSLPAQEPPPPTSARAAARQWSADGLVQVESKTVDAAFVRPGASLAPYARVWIRPVTVSFRRGWGNRAAPGGRTPVRSSDAERIKSKLSALVRDELVRQLEEGGYALADGPGDDVLDVQLSVFDLDVTAPDLPTAGRVTTYAVSAGEMTMAAELRDATSGEVIARAFDHARARESTRPRQITSVDNVAEAQHAAREWAEGLRRALDAARALASEPPAS